MIKLIYVRLAIDAKRVEDLLNTGWIIDVISPCHDFIVYHLKKEVSV